MEFKNTDFGSRRNVARGSDEIVSEIEESIDAVKGFGSDVWSGRRKVRVVCVKLIEGDVARVSLRNKWLLRFQSSFGVVPGDVFSRELTLRLDFKSEEFCGTQFFSGFERFLVNGSWLPLGVRKGSDASSLFDVWLSFARKPDVPVSVFVSSLLGLCCVVSCSRSWLNGREVVDYAVDRFLGEREEVLPDELLRIPASEVGGFARRLP